MDCDIELIRKVIAEFGINGASMIMKSDSSMYVGIGTSLGLIIGFILGFGSCYVGMNQRIMILEEVVKQMQALRH